jgi:uncharacterized protein YkwD
MRLAIHSHRAAALGVVLVAACIACRTGAGEAGEIEASDEEKAILELTNAERKKAGREPLAFNAKLLAAARAHSANMAKHNKAAHELDGKTMRDRVADKGYKYSLVGENVAWNQQTPEDVVESWMKSSGHRENILRKEFTEIGIGVARNKDGEPYYTQVFGRPMPAADQKAAAKTTMTITNDTRKSAKVNFQGLKDTSKLEPGATGTYSITSNHELQPVKVSIGKFSKDLPVQDGANYVIRLTDGTYEVTNEQPVETR